MPIDHTVLKVNYELAFEVLHPLESHLLKEKDGIVRCKLTWLGTAAVPGLVGRLIKHANQIGKIIWFQNSDPFKGSKPFVINWIGLENLPRSEIGTVIILVVTGQKTERIITKWTRKLSVFFGYPVSIIWEEDAQ